MPIYDLECPKCHKVRFDILISAKVDPAQLVCPACKTKGLIRKPCRVHARFFGEGFYKQHKKES